jgi:hypothetical protein
MFAYGWANTPAQHPRRPATLAHRLAVIEESSRKTG